MVVTMRNNRNNQAGLGLSKNEIPDMLRLDCSAQNTMQFLSKAGGMPERVGTSGNN